MADSVQSQTALTNRAQTRTLTRHQLIIHTYALGLCTTVLTAIEIVTKICFNRYKKKQ